jgi:hypothetical protein
MSYSTAHPYAQLDHRAWLFILICIPGWTGGFIQITTAFTNARRDRISGIPIAMTIGMLVHDSVFAVQFHHYFHNVDHLYWKLYWGNRSAGLIRSGR